MTWTIKSEHCCATIEKGYLYPTIEKAKRRYSALKREIRKELET